MNKFSFSLQLFGGGKGGSQTTNNNYRPLTSDELRMQKASADYAEAIQPSAYALYNRAIGNLVGGSGSNTIQKPTMPTAPTSPQPITSSNTDLLSLFNGDSKYNEQLNTYNQQMQKYNEDMQKYNSDLNAYYQQQQAAQSGSSTVDPDYSSLYKQQAATTANLTNQYNGLNSQLNGMMDNYNNQVGAVNARNDANSSYVKGVGQSAAARANANSGILGNETSLVNQQLRNGTIPQAVLNARQNTVNSMAQNALGGLLANNAASGTIGSDQFTDGLSGISKSVASTLNDFYSQDLNSYNNAMQQSLGNVGNYVNTDNSTAQQGVTNAGNWAQHDSNMAQQGLSNLGNAIQQQYNIGTGLLNQGSNMNALGLNQASQAQSASYATPLSLFGAATGQMQPTQQVWQPTLLSNQSNPISSTTTTSGGGGIFGGLLGGLAGNPGIFGK